MALAGNLAYRLYIGKLCRDTERFPEGIDPMIPGTAGSPTGKEAPCT